MSKTVVMDVAVRFGDCDPAGIVFFPNFLRWLDAASLDFFLQNGVPAWRESEKTGGVAGTPVLEINTRFVKSATYGETIQIHTTIDEWRGKVFFEKQLIKRGDDLLVEAKVTRAFVSRDPATGRLKAVEAPADIRARCE